MCIRDSSDITQTVLIVGAVMTVLTLLGSIVLISSGRKGYKSYRKETGRRN